jgi:hypothetical protein
MQTPLGELAGLDLSDHDLCQRILALDKHRLAEGLVVESLFDQYLAAFPRKGEDVPFLIDADTAIARNPGGGVSYAFVWDRGSAKGLGRYLRALGSRYSAWLVRFDESMHDFVAAGTEEGRLASDWSPLHDVARRLSGLQTARDVGVDPSVRDPRRINQSFWGYLSAHYGDDLGRRVVLPRLFMNFGIQPWFRYVWNIDRIYLQGDQLWHLEIKHKYPIQGNPLTFGLNDGELRLIGDLARCGLRSLHTIIVKPRWNKETSSMLLTNDMSARAAAAVIGREISAEDVRQALAQRAGLSGPDTSFSGRSALVFRSLPASDFSVFGTLGMPYTEVAGRIDDFMLGGHTEQVTDRWLRELRQDV